MALSESSNRRLKRQNALSTIVVFISANTYVAGGKTAKHHSNKERAIIRKPRGWANHFELLMLKYDQAYILRGNLEESMCVIMQCNSVSPLKAY